MSTNGFASRTFVAVGLNPQDDGLPALIERLVQANATLKQQRLDTRYEIRMAIDGGVCSVTITAANDGEVAILWRKVQKWLHAYQQQTASQEPNRAKSLKPGEMQALVLGALARRSPQTAAMIAADYGLETEEVGPTLSRCLKAGLVAHAGKVRSPNSPRHFRTLYKLVNGA